MGMMILGWSLIVVGFLFLLVAVAGAARKVFMGAATLGPSALSVKDVTALIEAILKAPQWLLTAAVGALLIYAGQRIVNGLPLSF